MKNHRIRTILCLGCLAIMLAAGLPGAGAWPSRHHDKAPDKEVSAQQILAEASKHMGKPYHWGGKGPNAFDCAGFVRYVYGRFGYQLAGSAGAQYAQGRPITEAELQPGDLVFYGGRGSSRSIGHVGIVTEVNDDGTFLFVHAARTGVRISHSSEHYYDMRFICACRVLSTDGENMIRGEGSGTDVDNIDNLFDENEKVYAFVRGTDITNKLDVHLVEIEPEPEPDTLDIAFVGSILSRKSGLFGKSTTLPFPNDYEHVVQQADVAVGLLEGPLSDSGSPLSRRLSRKRRNQMSTSVVMQLVYSGLDAVSLAASHVADLGVDGIRETMLTLDSAGIRHAGIRHAGQTAVVERNGYWYGFCTFGHNADSPDYMDAKEVREVIHSLRDTVDILVVNFVPVAEAKITDSLLYERTMQRFAATAVDCGADVVVGCSTSKEHAELYNGRLIYYGLAPFCAEGQKEAPVLDVKLLSDGTFIQARRHKLPMDDNTQMTTAVINPAKKK